MRRRRCGNSPSIDLYIEVLPERAGHALHTVFVDDLDERIENISARGIEPASRETYGNGVRKVIYREQTATRSASAVPPPLVRGST